MLAYFLCTCFVILDVKCTRGVHASSSSVIAYMLSLSQGTGVRSMVFHPDGKTLFCGLDQSLKVGLFLICYLLIFICLAPDDVWIFSGILLGTSKMP